MARRYFSFALGSLLWLTFSVTASLGGEPFKSIKASQETIINYEVVYPAIVMNGYPDPYPPEITVDFSTSTTKYSLEFKRNPYLNSSNFISILIDEYNNKVVDKNEYPNCYYIGIVKDHPDWVASMTACHGLQLEFGDPKDKENYFHMEPLSKTDTSMIQSHAFYKESEYSTKERTFGCESAEGFRYQENHPHQRVRRQASTYYVEFVAVNDDAQFAVFGRNVTATVQRTLSIANGMNNLYIRGFDIRVVLTMVVTFMAGNPFTVSADASDLLDSFRSYANNASGGLGDISRDNIMLLTGVDLIGSTIGLAFVGTMCTSSSVGLTQDGGMPLASVITVATHEMGHNFNMLHDDDNGRICSCPDDVCIMAAFLSSPPATRFSNCSASDLSMIMNQLSCLENVPAMIEGGPRCGNGLVENGEACDCGEPGFCTNPCCNANTCQLTAGAQCAHGTCCNTSTCHLLASDTVCREGTGECDITEFCTGSSDECPQDVFRMNGSPCASDTGYCINGSCPTLRAQCMEAWGTTEALECFPFNVQGRFFANCGTNSTDFIPCLESNVFCGQLQCDNGTYGGFYGIAGFTARFTVGNTQCRSFGVEPSAGIENPGLVDDGTRCGTDSVCIDQECRNLSTLNTLSCPVGDNGLVCSGNNSGICNNLGECSCLPGLTGLTCDTDFTITVQTSTEPPTMEEVSTEILTDLPTTEEVATTDMATTEEVATTDMATTEEVATTDMATTEEVATTDMATTEEVATTDMATTEEVATTDMATTEEVATTDMATTEEVATTDMPTTEEVVTTDMVTTGEAATTVFSTTEEVATTDLLTTEDVSTPTTPDPSQRLSCDWVFI